MLHWVVGMRGAGSPPPPLIRLYLLVAAIAYLPPFLAALAAPLPLWRAAPNGELTFLHDWGLAFGLLVSFPTLLLLFITDHVVLSSSLRQVERDEVIHPTAEAATTLLATWTPRFRKANIRSQVLGVVAGIGFGLATTLCIYSGHPNKSWIAPDGRLGVVAWAYTYGITLLYAMVIIYVWRCVTISGFLRALVAASPLRLLPFHPDRCGGLRPVGRLGLRNQYTLTVLGLNIVLLILVWIFSQGRDESLRALLGLASVAYFILGPLVFMAPLLPFRDGMLQAKAEWSSQVAGLIRKEFERLRAQITAGEVTSTDEAAIDRLRKLGAVIDELPVWPFDAQTLRKFATAYVVPVGLPIIGKLLLGLFSASS